MTPTLFQTVPKKYPPSNTSQVLWFPNGSNSSNSPHLKESTLVKRCTQTKFITLTHQNHPNGVVGKKLSMFNWVFFFGCPPIFFPRELVRMVSKKRRNFLEEQQKHILVKLRVEYLSNLLYAMIAGWLVDRFLQTHKQSYTRHHNTQISCCNCYSKPSYNMLARETCWTLKQKQQHRKFA